MRREEQAVSLGSPKQRALLALLLLHSNELVPRERLIDELWAGRPPATANAALNGYLMRLRRLLANGDGPGPLSTKAPGYVLEVPAERLDAHRFERLVEEGRAALARSEPGEAGATLRHALALWRGPPLADLAYEEFAQTEIHRLDELRLSALEERIEADLALGRYDALVPELEALVAEHPYRERLRAQLMLALYRSGRQAEALDAYRAARRTLVEDLGIEPGRRLQALEHAVLAHDPSLELPVESARRRRGYPAKLVVTAAVVLVLALVAAAALVARAGDPEPLVLAGDSVVVVDPETVAAVAEIPVGGEPGGIALGEGSVWVGNRDRKTLLRIDPATRVVRTSIPLGSVPMDVAVGAGSVWVLDHHATVLLRVDPQEDAVVARIPIRGRAWPTAFSLPHLRVGGGAVWIAHGGQVSRIEPATGKQTTVREAGYKLIEYGTDALWLVGWTDHGVIQRVLPSTTALLTEFRLGPIGSSSFGPGIVAVGNGAIWAATVKDKTLFKLDPELGNVIGGISIGARPVGVAFGQGGMWVVGIDNTLLKIDPASDRVVKRIRLSVPLTGSSPHGAATGTVVAGEGAVWIATA